MVKSSFLSANVRPVFRALIAFAFLPGAPAVEPPPQAVLSISKNSAGEETVTHGVLLSGQPGIIVTVAASVEPKATFLVGSGPPVPGRPTTEATVVLFDPGSRLLFLKVAAVPAGVPDIKLAAQPTTTTTALQWSPPDGPQPAIDAGPIHQLDGRPLALALRRLHFGSSRETDHPVPGTPVFNALGELAALPLSSLPEETGAWLGLPAAAIAKLASDFTAVGRAETGQLELGVAIGTTTPRIEFVKPGSRAQKAGLQSGDILLSLGGRPINDVFDVLDANFFLTAREPVTIRFLRGLETMSVTAPPVPPTPPGK